MPRPTWQSCCSGGQAAQAGHERGLRLAFASDDFAGTKWKNLTGTTRWSDGTLDHSHLTSVLWGVCKSFQARLDALEAWQAQRGEAQVNTWTWPDFNVRDPQKLYRLARQRLTQAMAFAEGRRGPCRRHGRVRWVSRPPRGRTTGCRPTS